jgi:aspartate/methionine/tyrosine aminotransferase
VKVSKRSDVPPFAVMEILGAVAQRRAAGIETYSLCAGEPGAGAPIDVRERAAQLLTDNHPLGYTETRGTPELREALAGHYGRWYDVDVDARNVAITTGSSGGFVLAFLAAFDTGDRVALVRPGYPAYRNILGSLGCEVVEIDCAAETRWQPTPDLLDAAVAANGTIAGLVLASPANPTGAMVDAAQMASIVDWCDANDVRLISDEIYHGIAYGESRGETAWSHSRSPVVVSSFSKYWAMPGWRLGWTVLPDDLVGRFDALAGNLALSPPTLPQLAAVQAFTDASYLEADAAVEVYRAHRDLVIDRLPDLGWGEVAPVDGAFYFYADVADAVARAGETSSVGWCQRLLAETGVALTPGTDFDPVAGGDWVRLSFAASTDVITAALDRIAAWEPAAAAANTP